MDVDGTTYYIYKNSYALPLGYTYDAYMTREEYDALGALEKQQAMMQAVVLEENTDFIKEITPKTYVLNIPYEAEYDGIIYEEGKFKVTDSEARLRLDYNTRKYSEIYLVFHGLDLSSGRQEKLGMWTKTNTWGSNYTLFRSKASSYYFGYEDIVLNLGYTKRKANETEITFSNRGTFGLEGISLYALPLGKLDDYYAKRTKSTLKDVVISNNKIVGNIDTWKDRMLVFNVPYSKGWTAYVDGEKVEVQEANVMYMAIPITKGSHEIVLKYKTPYLQIGLLISIVSAVMLIGIALLEKKK